MLGFASVGELTLGQVPIEFPPQVYLVGDVGAFVEEQERVQKRRFKREQEERVSRRIAIEDAVYGPPIEFVWKGKPVKSKTIPTAELADVFVDAQAKRKLLAKQKEDEADEERLEKLLLEL